MGGVLERLFPAEERRAALWLAAVLVAAGLAEPIANGLLQLPWFSARASAVSLLGVAVQSSTFWLTGLVPVWYVAALAVVRVARGPRSSSSFLLIASALAIGTALLEDVMLCVRASIMYALGSPIPTTWSTELLVQRGLPDLAGIAAVLLFALVVGGGASGLRRRVIDGLGLDDAAPRSERRLAVAFAALSVAPTIFATPLGLALDIVVLRYHVSGAPATLVLYAISFSSMFAAVYLAIRRFDAPHSSWLPFVAGAALAIATVPVYVLLRPPGVTIAAAAAGAAPALLGYPAGTVALVLLAAFLATRGRGTPPSWESVSIEERSPSEEVMHG